jgi:SAM-dependent methyltransferase
VLGLLKPGDAPVVDIGSNDGTLLSCFKQLGCKVYGIDPALEAAQDAKRLHGINTVVSYFGEREARMFDLDHGGAQLITACNVFAHVPDVHNFMRGIDFMLRPDGVFVSESHYLPSLLKIRQYDAIYHEHLRYYDLKTVSDILAQHGFEIFHARKIPTHGGSIRIYAARKGQREKTLEYRELLEIESDPTALDLYGFADEVARAKLDLLSLLRDLSSSTIYGVGAPSRAATLVNYCGLDDEILECIVEVEGSPKIGKYMPGTVIPVVDEKELYKKQPPYALILSWHVADEIMANLREHGYRGKFIVPLPEVRVLATADATKLLLG